MCWKTIADCHSIPERIQLAPLQLSSFDHGDLSSAGMKRQYSISSVSSSGQSSYCPSPPGSGPPTPMSSPHLERMHKHASHRSHPYQSVSGPSFQGVRCSSCLDRGEHVPMELGKPCVICDTAYPEQSQNGKAPRRKRNDRRLYSRLFTGNAKPNNISKDQSEAGSRFDLTGYFGLLQNQLLRMSPKLATEAALGDGRNKLGWKPLNPNNICKDVEDPLLVNKIEIHISVAQVLRDSDAILENCNDERNRQQMKVRNLLRSNPSETEMRNFLVRFVDFDWSERVEESCRQRGCNGFRVPFNPQPTL
jgi:hypothetical protein